MSQYRLASSPEMHEGEKYARLKFLSDMFVRYADYWDPELQRYAHNMKVAWGLNFGQWPAYVVDKLRSEGRRPKTYNFLYRKIITQVGMFMGNGYDVNFTPMDSRLDELVNTAKDMYLCDKDNMHWEVSEMMALRDMFMAVGYERMIISDENSELGNIAWESPSPLHILIDPGWKRGYVRDIKNYFEDGYFTASELMEMFPDKKALLQDLKAREESMGVDFGLFNGGAEELRFRESSEKWGSRHRLIIFHYIVKKERYWEYDLVNKTNFPETGFKNGSDEDRAIKIEYIKRMGLDPNHDIVMKKQIRKEKRVEAICPTISADTFLTAGKDKIQTNNCNIYPIGDRMNGQYKSTTDDLYDVQMGYNKGEMVIEDVQARSAKGAFALDEALAGGDPIKKREIEKEWNNPAARIWLEENSTAELGPRGGIIELPGQQPTPDMFTQNNRRFDMADQLSLVPAAMDSRSESTQESGKLYQSKVAMGEIGQIYGKNIYKIHKKEKAVAWLKQAKVTYSGWPRIFNRKGLKYPVQINQRMMDQFGTRIIKNDISMLPNMIVTLSVSQNSQNVRSELRSQHAESLNLLNDPQDRLIKLILLDGIYQTYELPDETREELSTAFQMLKINASMEQTLQHMNMKGQLGARMQSEQQQQQLQQGQQAGQDGPTQPNEMVSEESPQINSQMNQGTPQEQSANLKIGA